MQHAQSLLRRICTQCLISELECNPQSRIIEVKRGAHRRPDGRSNHDRAGGEAAAANDAYFAISGARERGSIDWNLQRIRGPAILDPFPHVAMHIENSPLVGLEATNRGSAIGSQFTVTAVTPAELRAEVGEARKSAECTFLVAKTVAGG